jgi:putative membrane protein
MFDRLPTVTVIFALLAALIHLYIFVLESVMFRRQFAWRTFGIKSQQDAETTHLWAFNQGFYNLFLALGVVIGVLLGISGDTATVGAGVGMVLLATGSMVAAALVLLAANRTLLRAVAVQGIAPLVAVLTLVVR